MVRSLQKKEPVKKRRGVEDDDDEDTVSRSFKAVYVGPDGTPVLTGRYRGKKPMQAATKAFTGIFRTYAGEDVKLKKNFKFGIVESTRGSKHKRYWYIGNREKLDEVIEVPVTKKDGTEDVIKYRHSNKVKRIPDEEHDPTLLAVLDKKRARRDADADADDDDDDDETDKDSGSDEEQPKKVVKKPVKKNKVSKKNVKKVAKKVVKKVPVNDVAPKAPAKKGGKKA